MEDVNEALAWNKLKVWGKFSSLYALHVTSTCNGGIHKMLLPHSPLRVQGRCHIPGSLDTPETEANIHCKDTSFTLFLGLVTTTKCSKMLQVSCMTGSCQQKTDGQVQPTLWQGTWTIRENHFSSLLHQVPSSLRDVSVQCHEMQHFLFSPKIFPTFLDFCACRRLHCGALV